MEKHFLNFTDYATGERKNFFKKISECAFVTTVLNVALVMIKYLNNEVFSVEDKLRFVSFPNLFMKQVTEF